jgi:HEAT repeat protein
MREPGNVDEQKTTLRVLTATSKEGAVSLAVHGEMLLANGRAVPMALSGMVDVATQLALHGLAMFMADASATPGDLLSAARILAAMPTVNDGGAAVEAQRQLSRATTIRFAARPRFTAEGQDLPEMELGDVLDDPYAHAMSRATPRASRAIPAPSTSDSDTRGGLFAQFAAPRTPSEAYTTLLDKLDNSTAIGTLINTLDDLAVHAENAARASQSAVVGEILYRIGRREQSIEAFDAKRAFTLTLKRLAKPNILGAIASQLPHALDRRDEWVAVLKRAGDDGADAIIEQLGAVEHQRDRRVYFDAFIAVNAGVRALMHMLRDPRWFVARNAAELLGELEVTEAEHPLAEMLHHEDDRVRRSSNSALMRLGTPRAMLAIQESLTAGAPQSRKDAATAVVARKDVKSAAVLVKALDDEKDEDVQCAFLVALGKLGTPDAVARLIRGAESERSLFKKKTVTYRVAAIHGLAEARTPQAMDALRTLQEDKDPTVREAALIGLKRVARGTTAVRQVDS